MINWLRHFISQTEEVGLIPPIPAGEDLIILNQEIERLRAEIADLKDRYKFNKETTDEDGEITHALMMHLAKIAPSYEELILMSSFHCAHLSMYWAQGHTGKSREEVAIGMLDSVASTSEEADPLLDLVAHWVDKYEQERNAKEEKDRINDIEFNES